MAIPRGSRYLNRAVVAVGPKARDSAAIITVRMLVICCGDDVSGRAGDAQDQHDVMWTRAKI
jgi:hypothetical protein